LEASPTVAVQLPIVDAHGHIVPGLTPEAMVTVMDELGISRIVLMAVGGGPVTSLADLTQLTIDTHQRYPERVIPFIGLNFIREFTPAQLRFLDRQLATGQFRGMGELNVLHLAGEITTPGATRIEIEAKRVPLDSRGAQDVMCLAAKHGVLLTIHMETTDETVAELDRALQRSSETRIIWAHQTPARSDAEALRRLLDTYPNLYADISPGFFHIMPGHYRIPEPWVALYEQFTDRFLIGLDMPFLSFWQEPEIYRQRAELLRSWLSQLSPETQRRMASENADRILAPRPGSGAGCDFLTR
jgi:hypothetical protein